MVATCHPVVQRSRASSVFSIYEGTLQRTAVVSRESVGGLRSGCDGSCRHEQAVGFFGGSYSGQVLPEGLISTVYRKNRYSVPTICMEIASHFCLQAELQHSCSVCMGPTYNPSKAMYVLTAMRSARRFSHCSASRHRVLVSLCHGLVATGAHRRAGNRACCMCDG